MHILMILIVFFGYVLLTNLDAVFQFITDLFKLSLMIFVALMIFGVIVSK